MSIKLIIDAGHGGEDTGGYSGGYREKDLTLPVARRVRDLLKNYNPAITRTEDTLLVWDKRAALVKDQYDYCLSIHFNIGGGTGVEAIHSHLSERGKNLATTLVNELNTSVGIPKRMIPVFSRRQKDGKDYYYMHRLTGRTTTVIIEIFFLDNDKDKVHMNLEKIAQAIASGFTKFLATQTVFVPPTAMNPRTIRQYNSDIHIYETKPGMKVDVDLGTRFKLERVSSIVKAKLAKGEKVLAGINGGFFNLDGSSEHLGMLIDEGLYYQVPSINFVDFIYYKNGKTEIRNMHGYDKAELSRLQAETHWAIGTSYALVVDGKAHLMLAEKFSHSKNKEPRTMIGQKADGTFVLVVTDGRVKDSAGLTATEQAALMLSLGCINAVNLDGGGSSTMVINRNGVPVVYNQLYDGFERSVGSVILVKEV